MYLGEQGDYKLPHGHGCSLGQFKPFTPQGNMVAPQRKPCA